MNSSLCDPCAQRTSLGRLFRASAAAAVLLLAPAWASAATLVVDDDGTYDAGTDGCDGVDPTFTTINDANTAAVDNDTIFVCPGTYVETQVDVTKALTFQGSGAANTIIDGGGGTGLTNAGTLRIRTTTGDVTVDGFTIQNPSAQGGAVTGLRFGISAKSSAPVTYTFTNNVIKGMNNPAWGMDYGVYTDGPAGALETFIFQYNTIMETGSNPILIERHTGPTDVSYNTIYRGVFSGGLSAYFNFSHSGTAITSLQRVSYNTFHMSPDPGPYTSSNGGGAVSFVGAFTGGASAGTFSNVEIVGNTIDGIQAYRRGISLFNNAAAPGTTGEISNAVIQCNQISGPGAPQTGSYGIRLNGLITGPTILNNAIDAVDTGFAGLVTNSAVAAGIVLNENSFTNIGVYAIDWQSDVSFDAENNWYGDPSGPTEAGNPGGTGAAIGASGGPVGSPVLDYDPWLLSGNDSDPGPCFIPSGPACTILDAGQIFSVKPKSKVVVSKINTDVTADNDKLLIKASFALPPSRSFSEITPIASGARVLLTSQNDSVLLDVTIPGGAYDSLTRVGWLQSGNGKTWKFTDKSGSAVGGIVQLQIGNKDSAKHPRVVKIKVKGKNGNYPVVSGDEPIQATVVLGDEVAAANGLCGESDYDAPDCSFNGSGNKLTCKK